MTGSGQPLPKKLGIKAGNRVLMLGTPDDVDLGDLPAEVRVDNKLGLGPYHVALVFVSARADLEDRLSKVKPRLTPTGPLWVCLPKQAANIETDLNEGVVRKLAQASGLTENKVVDIDELWSAMRCVTPVAKASKAK
jgi:hypothetical protein